MATEFSLRLLGPIGAAAGVGGDHVLGLRGLNGNLLVGPRLLYAMGEDGLAPRSLGAVHPRYRTPALAILVMGVWAALLVLVAALLTESRYPVVQLAGWEIDSTSRREVALRRPDGFRHVRRGDLRDHGGGAIFVFRWRLPTSERPYRCWGYPVVPALYVAILACVVVSTFINQRTESLVGAGFIATGVAVYFAVDRRSRFLVTKPALRLLKMSGIGIQ